jgi:hypothetical protein
MRKRTFGIEVLGTGLVVMVVAASGCGDGASASSTEAGSDAPVDALVEGGGDTGATPADGGGVCCDFSTRCDCLGGGGWAASSSACVPATSNCAADGRWHFETDSHGCQSVVTGSGPNCCGCSTLDAGDASDTGNAGDADAAGDSSCPANFCSCTCQDGGAGYRPQCDAVHCTSSDPCISGLDADGGWLVCGL